MDTNAMALQDNKITTRNGARLGQGGRGGYREGNGKITVRYPSPKPYKT